MDGSFFTSTSVFTADVDLQVTHGLCIMIYMYMGKVKKNGSSY